MIFARRFAGELWIRYEIYLLNCRVEATTRDRFFVLGNKLAEAEKTVSSKLKNQVLAARSELAESTRLAVAQQNVILEWIQKPWRTVDRMTLIDCQKYVRNELDQRPKLQWVPADGYVRHQLDLLGKYAYREAADWELERFIRLDWTTHHDKIFMDCGRIETPRLTSQTRRFLGADFHWRSWFFSS